MKNKLLEEITKLTDKKFIDNKIIKKYSDLIKNQEKLTKAQGAQNHICSFFVPINKKSKSIYLVDHIKAKMWIPPGGHIEENELPIDTVRREFEEELGHKLINEKIKLFDLSITAINRPWHNCITHYDFWYWVEVEKIPFKFLKKEFYHGDWFNLQTGIKKISRQTYQDILKKLIQAL